MGTHITQHNVPRPHPERSTMKKGNFMRKLNQCFFAALCYFFLVPQGITQENRTWESLGPKVITDGQVTGINDDEVVGAINSIALHPTDADTLFIASVNGGVWKTNNATDPTPTWTDMSDDLPSLSIGTVAYDLSDASFETILAGAGRYSSLGRRGGFRFGLYRSTDGGTNWSDIDGTSLDNQSINAIAADGNRILVSTGGSVSGSGLFLGEETTGTFTWTQLSGRTPAGAASAILPNGTTYEVVADPTVADRYYTLNRSGLYRVTLPAVAPEDAAWTRVSSAAMDTALSSASHGRIAIGPNGEVFVAMNVSNTVLSNLWRSPDGSTGWQALDTPITNQFGAWFLALVADPNDGNIAYVGGGGSRSEFRIDASLASGSQASSISGNAGTASNSVPHADARDLRFDAAGTLIAANDGGVYKQTNPTDATGDWFSINGDLVITEIHNAGWDSVSHIAAVGTIDNGTNIQNDFVRERWLHVQGGDGGDIAIDDTGSATQSERYMSSQNLGSFRRRTYDQNNIQTGTSTVTMSPPVCGAVDCFTPSWRFTTPFSVNAVNPIRLVAGGSNGVFESIDQGQNIVQLLDGGGTSVPSVNGSGSSDPIAYGADGNADALYIGQGDDVWVRTSGGFGGAMTRTDPSSSNSSQIVDVVIHPNDDQTAFAIDSNAVYHTANAGTNWTNVTGNLSAVSSTTLRSIAFSTSNPDGAVIVGTDVGVYIARGNGSSENDSTGNPVFFTDWSQLGVGMPPSPIFDLEYDTADELLIAGTLGRGAWALNMEERSPIDVALVLDKSGSMGSPACTGCDTKMLVLQDAAELFIETWQMLSDVDDRIATIFFDSSTEAFSTGGGDELVSLSANGDDMISYIRSKTDGGATAMGGGSQRAINLLTDTTRPRSLVVFTDGMQNRDPMIELTAGTYEIINTGRAGSGVSPTVPPTQLNTALDITFNTIGVGVTPTYEAELSAMAAATDGLHKSTNNADADLRRFFIEQLVDILRTASPQLIDYQYANSGRKSESVFVDNGSKELLFAISWNRRAADQLRFKIYKDGKDVTDFATERKQNNFYELVSFDLKSLKQQELSGTWEVRLQDDGNIDYEVAVLSDHISLDYQLAAYPTVLRAGKSVMLSAETEQNGLPFGDGIRARVRIEKPTQSLTNLLSLTKAERVDPQNGETHAEAKLRHLLQTNEEFRKRLTTKTSVRHLRRKTAGRFTVPFFDTKVAGTYKLTFFLQGNGEQSGKFTRQEERYFVVNPGPFRKGSSEIRTVEANEKTGDVRILIRPRDTHGNLLGANQAHKLSASVPASGYQAKISDINDGWYELSTVSEGLKQRIKIAINGVTVALARPGKLDVK